MMVLGMFRKLKYIYKNKSSVNDKSEFSKIKQY